MNHLPSALEELIEMLGRLPGIGARTATRLALSMLDWPDEVLGRLGSTVSELHRRVHFCSCCGNYCEDELCEFCRDERRNRNMICVVETPSQIMVIENSGDYHGLYHVLGGRLSPLRGKGPGDLRIRELRQRLEAGGVTELIIATSPDVEGEATAHFLAEEFAGLPVTISRIASGIPAGADLNYADAATITMALGGRRVISDGGPRL